VLEAILYTQSKVVYMHLQSNFNCILFYKRLRNNLVKLEQALSEQPYLSCLCITI